MKKRTYDKLKQRVDELEKLVNGGKGSGNFGHSGRPGKIGGSAKGDSLATPQIEDDFRDEPDEALEEKIEEAQRRVYDLQDEITAEIEFGGDTSHLVSLEQEAQSELDELKRELATRRTREYDRAEYEQALGEYKGEMASIKREIESFETNNKGLLRSAIKAHQEGNTTAAEVTEAVIDGNQRKIENLKEKGRQEVARYAAKAAKYQMGTGNITQTEDGYSVKLGQTTKNYETEYMAKTFQDGARDAYRGRALAPTEVKETSYKAYDVVYKQTDVGIGYTTMDETQAQAYSDGWNAAAKEIDVARSRLMPLTPFLK